MPLCECAPLRGEYFAGKCHAVPMLLGHDTDPNVLSNGTWFDYVWVCVFFRNEVPSDHSHISDICVKDPLKDNGYILHHASVVDLAKIISYNNSIQISQNDLDW